MLEVRNVSKSFGPLRALEDISIQFNPGEIHAVLGENGAGKSTLMHVMAGFLTPDEGSISLDDVQLPLGRPFDCKRLGIGMVHQHFTLVPNFTVGENLALASLPSLQGTLDARGNTSGLLEKAKELGWELKDAEFVRDLPVGARQRIEIVKAMYGDPRVVIFDEPTAVLTGDETNDLFRVLRNLRDLGKIVVLIAHKLSEVLAVADRITVLRKGKFVATALRTEVDQRKLAEWMVGELPKPILKTAKSERGGTVTVRNLTVTGDRGELAVRGVSCDIPKGEIVGFGGVDGNGQVEMAEALAGIGPGRGVEFEGHWTDVRPGYVPQDRQADGLALGLSILDNLLIGGIDRADLSNGPFMSPTKAKAWSKNLIERFSIKAERPTEPVSSLSGGNQQKVVVSRTLDRNPEFLVVVNPTRGLDIKAADYVQTQILEARNRGTAIALFSTDLDELNLLADRVYFMSRGELAEGATAENVVGA